MEHHMHHGAPTVDFEEPPSESPAMDGHEQHMNEFLDGWGENEEEILGMLHVPLLHGGFKEVLLFSTVSTASPGTFTLACFVLALCAFLLELLRLTAWWVESRKVNGEKAKHSCECKHCTSVTVSTVRSLRGATEGKHYDAIHDANSRDSLTSHSSGPPSSSWASVWYVLLGALHFLIYLASTLLMLIAMTMNIYLILSLAFGASVGKLSALFARRKIDFLCK